MIFLLEGTVTNPGGCKTIKGPSPNTPCVFPFEFKGIDYNQCTWEGDSIEGAWCSTKVDSKGKHVSGHGNWGNCGDGCPMTPKITTGRYKYNAFRQLIIC